MSAGDRGTQLDGALPVVRVRLSCPNASEYRRTREAEFEMAGVFIPSDRFRPIDARVQLKVELADGTLGYDGEAVVAAHKVTGRRRGYRLRLEELAEEGTVTPAAPPALGPPQPPGAVASETDRPALPGLARDRDAEAGRRGLELASLAGLEQKAAGGRLFRAAAAEPARLAKPAGLELPPLPELPPEPEPEPLPELPPEPILPRAQQRSRPTPPPARTPPPLHLRPRNPPPHLRAVPPPVLTPVPRATRARAEIASGAAAAALAPVEVAQARPRTPATAASARRDAPAQAAIPPIPLASAGPARRSGRSHARVALAAVALVGAALGTGTVLLTRPDGGVARREAAFVDELRRADDRLRAGRLAVPAKDSALDHLVAARELRAADPRLAARLTLLAEKLVELGENARARGDLEEAAVHFRGALRADPRREAVRERLRELASPERVAAP